MAKTDHFPVATRVIDGDRSKTITVRVATCSVCGEHEDVTDNKPGGLAVAPIAQKFRARGWEIGPKRSRDRCPKHAKHPPRPATRTEPEASVAEKLSTLGRVTLPPPPAPLAVVVATPSVSPPPTRREIIVDAPMPNPPAGTDVMIRRSGVGGPPFRQTGWRMGTRFGGASISSLKKSAMGMLGNSALVDVDFVLFTEDDGTMGWKPLPKPATPPATPETLGEHMTDTVTPAEKPGWTREQRRKARDALDVHYDDERLRYRGDWTDKSLADSINVPRALLAEVRDDYYGPDRNEAEAKRRANLTAALAEAEKTLERLMNTATDCETLINNLKKALA